MPLIVDTYNVLHQVGILPPEIAGIDTRGLIELIRNSRYRHEPAVLFCDGVPDEGAPTGRVGAVSLKYSGSGVIADDLISAKIRNSSFPKRLIVVSTDRAVQREARRRRCRILSSEEFLSHLVADHEAARPKPRRITAEGASCEPGPDREKTYTPPPRATLLPMDLVREAEALAQMGIPDDPPLQVSEQQALDAAAAATSHSIDPADDSAAAEPSKSGHDPTGVNPSNAEPMRRVPPPELVLSPDLIREAEMLARAGLPDDAPSHSEEIREDRDNQEEESAPSRAEQPDAPPESPLDEIITAEPPEAFIPEDLIKEAESLWRSGPAGAAPAEPGAPQNQDEFDDAKEAHAGDE